MAYGVNHGYPPGLKIIELESCQSTNSYLKENYGHVKFQWPVLVTAKHQTGGRGRDQRVWFSPEGKGLYSSFGFELPRVDTLHLLPLVAGIAIIQTLMKLTGLTFDLKWPNDVLYKGKKIAGILIENSIGDGHAFCVVGMGINLNQMVSDFPGELVNRAVSLKMIAAEAYSFKDINPLLATLFWEWLDKLQNNAHHLIIQTVNRYSGYFMEQPISFHQPPGERVVKGIFKGINADGGLILGNSDGSLTIYYAGEIR